MEDNVEKRSLKVIFSIFTIVQSFIPCSRKAKNKVDHCNAFKHAVWIPLFTDSAEQCLFPHWKCEVVTSGLNQRKCLSTAGIESKITPHIIQADFYRQNWPFLLLDTQLNVALCQHSVSTVYIIYTYSLSLVSILIFSHPGSGMIK